MKQAMLYAIEIVSMIGIAFQPLVAQATGMEPLGWGAQLGVIGMLGALLWWQMARTTPEIQRLHTIEINRTLESCAAHSTLMSDNIEAMTSEIKGMRGDAADHNKNWDMKLEQRPCIGLDGFRKIEAAIKEEVLENG